MDKPVLIGVAFDVYWLIKNRSYQTPIKSKDIEFKLRISGVSVRECVAELRKIHKLPICSGAKGYYFAPNKPHWERTKAQLLSRAKELIKAANSPDEFFFDGEQSKLF